MNLFKKLRHSIKVILYWCGIGKFVNGYWKKVKSRRQQARLQNSWGKIVGLVHESLSKNGISYCADFGTLLGIIRDNGPIKHDEDIDFTVSSGVDVRKLITTLVDAGFKFYRGFKYDGMLTELTFTYEEVNFDFFFQFIGEDGVSYYFDYIPQFDYTESKILSWMARKVRKPAFGKFITRNVSGVQVAIPENYDEVLRIYYGSWRIPDPSWNYETGVDTRRRMVLPHIGEPVSIEKCY